MPSIAAAFRGFPPDISTALVISALSISASVGIRVQLISKHVGQHINSTGPLMIGVGNSAWQRLHFSASYCTNSQCVHRTDDFMPQSPSHVITRGLCRPIAECQTAVLLPVVVVRHKSFANKYRHAAQASGASQR